jgi:prefoldin subunit 5
MKTATDIEKRAEELYPVADSDSLIHISNNDLQDYGREAFIKGYSEGYEKGKKEGQKERISVIGKGFGSSAILDKMIEYKKERDTLQKQIQILESQIEDYAQIVQRYAEQENK